MKKNNNRKPIDNMQKWEKTAMIFYYCKYKCWLQRANSNYWYQIKHAIFNIPSTI